MLQANADVVLPPIIPPQTLDQLIYNLNKACTAGCFNLFIKTIIGILNVILGAIQLPELEGDSCAVLLVNLLFALINEVIILLNCILTQLLTVLETPFNSQCCQLIIKLLVVVITALAGLLSVIVNLVAALLGSLLVSII